jgi:hypothetical protein
MQPVQPTAQWELGPFTPGVKREGNEADHSTPSSAKVENTGPIPQFPHTP